MSVYGLFLQADWVVKAVMIALLLASFWSWAIIFEKMLRLRSLKRSAQGFEDTFWSGVSLEDLYDRVGSKPDDPMSSIFSAAMQNKDARCRRGWRPVPRHARLCASASSRS
jgi:biopolymer transport protein TolQ